MCIHLPALLRRLSNCWSQFVGRGLSTLPRTTISLVFVRFIVTRLSSAQLRTLSTSWGHTPFTIILKVKSRCLRKPGRRNRWGSADFLLFLAVFYFRSVMLKGNIFIFKHLIVFEIRPPPPKNRPLRTRNPVKFKA